MIQISIICKEEQELKQIIALLSAQEDFIIVSTGHSGFDALKSIDYFHPDIIIMDFLMNDINGTELAPIIRQKSPATKLIMLSLFDDTNRIMQAIVAGISGYLLKQHDMDKLINAVRIVLFDGYYVSKPVETHVYNYPAEIDSKSDISITPWIYLTKIKRPFDISKTGIKILALMIKGYTDKEIAEELCIAPGTIRNCLFDIKRKTGQKNRVQIVINLLAQGMIEILPRN